MNDEPLVLGLAAVFAGLTVLLVVLAGVSRSPVPLVVALAFGAATVVFWYQATGRLRSRLAGRARRQRTNRGGTAAGPRGASGAGPRDDWEPPGGWERWERREARGRQRANGRGANAPTGRPDGPTAAEARRVLGVARDADEAAVREAYRERVKEVHPDRGGDEEAFRRVTDAYERLTEG